MIANNKEIGNETVTGNISLEGREILASTLITSICHVVTSYPYD